MLARIDVSEEHLGFTSCPPCIVEMKLFEVGERWTAFVLSEPGWLPAVFAWLDDLYDNAHFTAPEDEPRLMRVVFEELSLALSSLLAATEVMNLTVRPDGGATVLVRDHPAHLEATTDEVLGHHHDAEMRFPLGITARQENVLAHAVEMGYYDDPPSCHAADIANEVGMRRKELEQSLRDGESEIFNKYAMDAVASKWDAVKSQIKKIRGPDVDPMLC